jgi:hypothetical protein
MIVFVGFQHILLDNVDISLIKAGNSTKCEFFRVCKKTLTHLCS